MHQSLALKYNQLVISANRQSRNMGILAATDLSQAEMMDRDYFEQIVPELPNLQEQLAACGTVLAFLRDIPNACLNAEAMDAIIGLVEHAESISESEWAADILRPADGIPY